MAYAFNDDKGKYDLDENVLGGATNTLYDAEQAIAENAADIVELQKFENKIVANSLIGTNTYCEYIRLGKLVYVSFMLTLPSTITNGWNALYNLPFQALNNSDFRAFAGNAGQTPVALDGLVTGKSLKAYVPTAQAGKRIFGDVVYATIDA